MWIEQVTDEQAQNLKKRFIDPDVLTSQIQDSILSWIKEENINNWKSPIIKNVKALKFNEILLIFEGIDDCI